MGWDFRPHEVVDSDGVGTGKYRVMVTLETVRGKRFGPLRLCGHEYASAEDAGECPHACRESFSWSPVVAVVAWLLCPVLLWAAPPRLVLPAEVTPKDGWIRLTPDTDAAAVAYVGLDGVDAIPVEELADPRRFLLPARGLPAGVYRFAAVAASKTGELAQRRFAVVVGDQPQPPGPKPAPPDPPRPEPHPPSALWLIVVEETAEASGRRAAFLSDKVLLSRMAEKGHKHRLTDQDALDGRTGKPPADLAGWLSRAKGKPLPHLFLAMPDGTVRYDGPLPKTPADLVELLKAKGG